DLSFFFFSLSFSFFFHCLRQMAKRTQKRSRPETRSAPLPMEVVQQPPKVATVLIRVAAAACEARSKPVASEKKQ
ncbi:hypothetical protein AK812_SmicGene48007, partial [Symbiodinium microadriaticum]